MKNKIKDFLDERVDRYNRVAFIEDDPIALPHRQKKLQDKEIIGFWVAMLAWGQRKTIIKSGERLLELMDQSPHDFVLNHSEQDLKSFEHFVHRTFQPTDALYFIEFFKHYYQEHDSLEQAFSKHIQPTDETIEHGLVGFSETFFNLPFAPQRTKKHVPNPKRKSTCKRLNMFLRWMVRQDDRGVDFGVWKSIKPAQLLIPYDVHVERSAKQLGLVQRKQRDWKAVLELTSNLRKMDPTDPVKYDFALFGLGVLEKADMRRPF